MSEFSKEEIEERKKAVFDSMSKRGQKRILKTGYDKWDPFQAPKDPIDIRKDKTKRTSQTLVREFLQSRSFDDISNNYSRGVLDICIGIINNDERYIAMLEFANWYNELLRREGLAEDQD